MQRFCDNPVNLCYIRHIIIINEVGNTYEYDILGRLVKVTDPNGEETNLEYNAEGWQTKIIDPRGEETVFTHDAIGRVIQIDYPGAGRR